LQNLVIKKTGTITGKEFQAQAEHRGPNPVANVPPNAVVAPGDYTTSGRFRRINLN
jgi:hypothetical protein